MISIVENVMHQLVIYDNLNQVSSVLVEKIREMQFLKLIDGEGSRWLEI